MVKKIKVVNLSESEEMNKVVEEMNNIEEPEIIESSEPVIMKPKKNLKIILKLLKNNLNK